MTIMRFFLSVMMMSWISITMAAIEPSTQKSTSQQSSEVESFAADMWTESVDVARVLWKECSKAILDRNSTQMRTTAEDFALLVKCAKRKTLRALDRTLNSEVISLSPGINLVKYEQLDRQGRVVKHDEDATSNETLAADGDWRYSVLRRMARVFNTHVLKFDLQDRDKLDKAEGRGRRHRNHMMQMMMFGITSMGMILVPMGFQFLAVLGGKALLLAKLALLLSSIQGLKKISAAPVNYGFYPVPDVAHHIEKRGHDSSFLSKATTSTSSSSSSKAVEEDVAKDKQDAQDDIKYRYDADSKSWKTLKRSYSNLGSPYDAYPVYPAAAGYPEGYIHHIQQGPPMAPYFVPAVPYGVEEAPTEMHAEYTIDLPVNKVQFKRNV